MKEQRDVSDKEKVKIPEEELSEETGFTVMIKDDQRTEEVNGYPEWDDWDETYAFIFIIILTRARKI